MTGNPFRTVPPVVFELDALETLWLDNCKLRELPRDISRLTRLNTRRDEPAYRLLLALPGISPLAVRLVFGPMLWAHRLSGYVPPAFRYPFEGDVSLQNQASEVLKTAGVDPAGVTFVAADFEREDWLSRLAEAGFDADKPTLFLWEGVTPYLDRVAVEDTLRKIAGTAQVGIDSTPPSSERAAELLRSCWLSPGEQHTVGPELDGKRAWGGFATAIVK